MSYRNDHDAALQRIDALEAELARARSDDGAVAARAELARLEAEIRRAREARDKILDEIDVEPRRRVVPRWIGVLLAIVLTVAWFAIRAIGGSEHHIPPEKPAYIPPLPPPVPAPAPKLSGSANLIVCVEELDAAIAKHARSSEDCVNRIKAQAADTTLGDDVHALLVRWRDAEQGIAMSTGEAAVDYRDSLAPEIRKVVISSFTR